MLLTEALGSLRFFFFQAEDGIRDGRVTGVQTCALPISVGTASARTSTTLLRTVPSADRGSRLKWSRQPFPLATRLWNGSTTIPHGAIRSREFSIRFAHCLRRRGSTSES